MAPSESYATETWSQAERVITMLRPRVKACYVKALAEAPTLAGEATFAVELAKDGRASKVAVQKRKGLNESVVECLVARLKALEFTTDGKPYTVLFPFTFAPKAP